MYGRRDLGNPTVIAVHPVGLSAAYSLQLTVRFVH